MELTARQWRSSPLFRHPWLAAPLCLALMLLAADHLFPLPLPEDGLRGRRWWFVNGQPLGETAAEADFNHAFSRSGRYQLSVLDQSGQTARLEFSVGD